MAMRRGARPPHVRPRPPSTGRPKPSLSRPRRVRDVRIGPRHQLGRSRRLPLVARLLLALAVVILVGAVLYAGMGGLPRAVASLGGTIGAVVDRLTATPTPTAASEIALETPLLDPPEEPYTNRSPIELTGSLPTAFIGRPGFSIRISVTHADEPPQLVREIAVGATATFHVAGVELSPGRNDFTATLVGPDGDESEPSPVVTFILDTEPPPVTITSPKNGAVISRDRVDIVGKTQGRSAVIARNEANGATATATAASDGRFELNLPLAAGTNGITVTATDPAGNSASTVLSLRRGSGQLTVTLTASRYRFRQAELPSELDLEASVTSPDGRPLPGASVLFTVSIPGVAPITNETVSGGDGVARFQTVIPKSAATGTGPIAVLVTTSGFGTASDRTAITITK